MSEETRQLQEQPEEQAGMDTFFAEPSPAKQETAKQGGLSRNVKTLIACGVVLLLLGGGLTTVLLLNRGDGGEGTLDSSITSSVDSTTELIPLNEGLAADLTEVQIDGTSAFTVYRVSAATETEDAVYSIKGMEDLPLSAPLLSTVVNNGSELSANSLVEEQCTNLEKYGISDDAPEVTMTYADGSKFTFTVGSASPLDSAMTYCAVEGNVYLVKSSLMANYQNDALFFVSNTVLEEPAEEDYPIVKSVRVERKDLDYDIFLEHAYDAEEDEGTGGTAASHVMREPIFAYLSVDKSVEVTNGMFGLSATKVLQVHPTAEDLAEAGLDDPFCTVTMICDDGNTYTLHFGDTYKMDDGTKAYYMYMEGVEVLYAKSADAAVWATMQPGDITSANIFGTMVWNISKLDVTAGDQKLLFAGEGEDEDTYVVTKNGETCETERFRLFYRFLLGIYGEELCFDPLPDKEPDASVHIVTQDGLEDYTVAFYKLDNLNTMVAVNGEPSYKIRSSCLDVIAHNMEIFDTDEEFTTTWQ